MHPNAKGQPEAAMRIDQTSRGQTLTAYPPTGGGQRCLCGGKTHVDEHADCGY